MKKPWLVQYILNVLCGFWTDRILSFLRPWARSQRAREPRSLSSKEGRRRQSQAWSANTWWSTNGARWWVRRWILVLLRFCFPTKMVTYYLKKTTFNLDWPSHDFFLIFPITNPLWLGNREDFLVVPSANPRNAAGKNRFKQISAWINACQSARNELGIKGMCCVGGKTVQGKALYVKAKAIFGKWARAVPVSRARSSSTAFVVVHGAIDLLWSACLELRSVCTAKIWASDLLVGDSCTSCTSMSKKAEKLFA